MVMEENMDTTVLVMDTLLEGGATTTATVAIDSAVVMVAAVDIGELMIVMHGTNITILELGMMITTNTTRGTRMWTMATTIPIGIHRTITTILTTGLIAPSLARARKDLVGLPAQRGRGDTCNSEVPEEAKA